MNRSTKRKKTRYTFKNRLLFWTSNAAAAILLFLLLCFLALHYLDDYTRHGHYVLVPDLRGLVPGEALPVVESKELQLEVVDSVYNKSLPGGIIVEQFPLPDAKVKNNRVIQLTINATLPEMVTFPDLRQSSYRQALQKLKSSRFRPGKIEYVPSPYANLVMGFHRDGIPIDAGERLPVGEVVDILLGKGTTETETVVPHLHGKTLEEAREILLHAYLNPGDQVEDYTIRDDADRAAARVYDQRPAPGIAARGGSVVTIYLSRNPRKEPARDPRPGDETGTTLEQESE